MFRSKFYGVDTDNDILAKVVFRNNRQLEDYLSENPNVKAITKREYKAIKRAIFKREHGLAK